MEKQVIKMKSDGNCLFRAISYCLTNDQENHAELRSSIVEHVIKHWSIYGAYIIGDESYGVSMQSALDYRHHMSKNSTHTGQVELIAAESMFDISLKVYRSANGIYVGINNYRWREGSNEYSLLYTGDNNIGHYDVLEDVELQEVGEQQELDVITKKIDPPITLKGRPEYMINTDEKRVLKDEKQKTEKQVIKMTPDGNCLFRAISYCLTNDQENHAELRSSIVEYVIQNWSIYRVYIIGDESYRVSMQSALDYRHHMSKNATYAGQVELDAAESMFDISLKVYRSANGVYVGINNHDRRGGSNEYSLLYTGHSDRGHYDVLEDVELQEVGEQQEDVITKKIDTPIILKERQKYMINRDDKRVLKDKNQNEYRQVKRMRQAVTMNQKQILELKMAIRKIRKFDNVNFVSKGRPKTILESVENSKTKIDKQHEYRKIKKARLEIQKFKANVEDYEEAKRRITTFIINVPNLITKLTRFVFIQLSRMIPRNRRWIE